MEIMAKIRLANEPRQVQTKTGTPMASGFGFADLGGESGLGLGVVAFNRLAGDLLKYHKGDNVRITGTMKENNYTNKSGEEIKGYQVVVDGLMGVKAARTQYNERKPKPNNADQQQRNQATEEFYNDSLSF